MGKAEEEAFLTSLAVERNVAAATQNLALSAIFFLYREVLERPLPWLDSVERAKKPARLPTVLTRQEVSTALDGCDGTVGLVLRLLSGTGMRLRVKDAIPSLPICSKAAMTSAPCRNCWATPTSAPR